MEGAGLTVCSFRMSSSISTRPGSAVVTRSCEQVNKQQSNFVVQGIPSICFIDIDRYRVNPHVLRKVYGKFTS